MCNCIEDVNKKLAEMGKNTKLDIPITFSGKLSADRVAIKTCKLDDGKREKPITVTPAYCPFCGKLYT